MSRQFCRWWLFSLAALAGILPVRGAELASVVRRPVGLAASADGSRLYVANRESGTISVVDLLGHKVAAEHSIGKRLSAIAAVPGTSQLLATDEAAHELLLLDTDGDAMSVASRLPVSPYPVSICLAADGKSASIASLWSRRLTFVDLAPEPKIATVFNLPFAPRCQHLLPGRDRLLVADSFGGRLALVEVSTRKLVESRQFPGHNVRGLGTSPDGKMLVVAHQMLNDLAHSIRNDIHWGLLMSNDLRWLEVNSLLAGGDKLYYGAHMHPLGDPGKGGGDPGGLDVSPDGLVCVSLSGVNQVAFGKEGDFSMQRVGVGRRPTAVKVSSDSRTAYVCNTHDDSISVVNLAEREVTVTIPLGPQPELSVVQQGELLFFDARLSHDGWMSCHSCHTDGHANGEKNDNFSDRSFGAPKRVLSLFGVKETLPLAWNGGVQTLQRQIENSLDATMQREDPLPKADVKKLVAYVQSLENPPPLPVLRGTLDTAAVERGKQVFAKRDCASCHAPPTYTSPAAYDVGLPDAQGNREFNPPSLRGLSHRGPFLHDNSAATLDEVFTKHGHPNASVYEAAELKDLKAFLESL
jgi:YVTN family beta-propeller protein